MIAYTKHVRDILRKTDFTRITPLQFYDKYIEHHIRDSIMNKDYNISEIEDYAKIPASDGISRINMLNYMYEFMYYVIMHKDEVDDELYNVCYNSIISAAPFYFMSTTMFKHDIKSFDINLYNLYGLKYKTIKKIPFKSPSNTALVYTFCWCDFNINDSYIDLNTVADRVTHDHIPAGKPSVLHGGNNINTLSELASVTRCNVLCYNINTSIMYNTDAFSYKLNQREPLSINNINNFKLYTEIKPLTRRKSYEYVPLKGHIGTIILLYNGMSYILTKPYEYPGYKYNDKTVDDILSGNMRFDINSNTYYDALDITMRVLMHINIPNEFNNDVVQFSNNDEYYKYSNMSIDISNNCYDVDMNECITKSMNHINKIFGDKFLALSMKYYLEKTIPQKMKFTKEEFKAILDGFFTVEKATD